MLAEDRTFVFRLRLTSWWFLWVSSNWSSVVTVCLLLSVAVALFRHVASTPSLLLLTILCTPPSLVSYTRHTLSFKPYYTPSPPFCICHINISDAPSRLSLHISLTLSSFRHLIFPCDPRQTAITVAQSLPMFCPPLSMLHSPSVLKQCGALGKTGGGFLSLSYNNRTLFFFFDNVISSFMLSNQNSLTQLRVNLRVSRRK